MKNIVYSQTLVHVISIFMNVSVSRAQPYIEPLGLENKFITSMAMYGSAIVVGTNGEGVFYQDSYVLPDSGWINLGLEGKNVTAVYPHKSGPISWGIAAGIFPEGDDSTYIYCNSAGDGFFPNSAGISDSLAEGVYSLAGFPDMTICGEKYAATGGALYRQLFGDTLWTAVYESTGIEGYGIINVKTKENLGGLVLAGGSEGYTGILLIKSYNFGDTWEYLYPPGQAIAFDFDVDSSLTDFKTIFVSHGSTISRSLNGGSTWDVVYEDGWNYFNEIIYDSYNSRILAAGGDGLDTSSAILFFSEDLGENWYQVPLNFGGPIVGIELAWDGYLYMVAPLSGVYRIDLDDLSIYEPHLPQAFVLHQNYPNPFNPITTIRFDLPETGNVELVIYDILGREVAELVKGRLVSGTHDAVWNASNATSGVYFYRLTVRQDGILSYADTKKLIVLK